MVILGLTQTRTIEQETIEEGPPSAFAEPPPEMPPRMALALAALDEAIHLFRQMKEDAVGVQAFEWAAAIRDQEDKLRKTRRWLDPKQR